MHLRKKYLLVDEKQLVDILKKIGLRGTNIPHYMAWLSFVFISIPGGNETISLLEMLQLSGWESESAKISPFPVLNELTVYLLIGSTKKVHSDNVKDVMILLKVNELTLAD